MLIIPQDPRQFVPPNGQSWTTHEKLLHESHSNVITHLQDQGLSNVWTIRTEPKVGIGQRCFFLTTPNGNVLWDCITLLDLATIDFINKRGGLKAIVISHPHFYSTHLRWAETFRCPAYISAEDVEWCVQQDLQHRRRLIESPALEILPGIHVIKLGGHFPGSSVLRYEESGSKPEDAHLFVADTFLTTPSALYHVDRQPGTTSYSFLWSIPNAIPLPPATISAMWQKLKPWAFSSTHGLMTGQDVTDPDLKSRVLESMKIQIRAMGWSEDVDLLSDHWP